MVPHKLHSRAQMVPRAMKSPQIVPLAQALGPAYHSMAANIFGNEWVPS